MVFIELQERNELPVLYKLKERFTSRKLEIPKVEVVAISGEDYNILIPVFHEEEELPS